MDYLGKGMMWDIRFNGCSLKQERGHSGSCNGALYLKVYTEGASTSAILSILIFMF